MLPSSSQLQSSARLAKLKSLLEVANQDTISRTDFMAAFEKVLKIFAEMREVNKKQMSDMMIAHTYKMAEIEKMSATHSAGMESEVKKARKEMMSYCMTELAKILKEQKGGMDFMYDKVLSERAKHEKEHEKMMKEMEEMMPKIEVETPEETRDKLELIAEEEEKLKISAIGHLREELDELKKRFSQTPGTVAFGGGSAQGGRIVKVHDLSGSLDGVTKTFSLPAFWRVISVHAASFPFILRPTTDYTTDGSAFTITFTSAIESSTTLASGQTINIIYAES